MGDVIREMRSSVTDFSPRMGTTTRLAQLIIFGNVRIAF